MNFIWFESGGAGESIDPMEYSSVNLTLDGKILLGYVWRAPPYTGMDCYWSISNPKIPFAQNMLPLSRADSIKEIIAHVEKHLTPNL